MRIREVCTLSNTLCLKKATGGRNACEKGENKTLVSLDTYLDMSMFRF